MSKQQKHPIVIETNDGHQVRVHVHENGGKKPFVKIKIDDDPWHQVLPGQVKQGVPA